MISSTFHQNLDRKDRTLYLSFFILAVSFCSLIIPFHPYPGSFVLKALPVLCLVLLALKNISGKKRALLVLALLFSMAGDISLDIDRIKLFTLGLVFFLTAHLFYIILFLQWVQFSARKIVPSLLLASFALIMGYLLRDIPANKFAPVMIYLAVIIVMGISSFLMQPVNKLVIAGAMTFILSDSLIAIDKFLVTIPNALLFIILLYYTAQFLIVSGFLRKEE